VRVSRKREFERQKILAAVGFDHDFGATSAHEKFTEMHCQLGHSLRD
jgi:hypothetical protein